MKMYSPDGKMEIDAHPSKVESLIARGWSEEKKTKSKPKAKVEEPVADELVQSVDETHKEFE